jgi:hypothetical protein
MKTNATLLTMALVLCACANAPQYKWQRAGATQDQLTREAGQCEAQAFGIASNDTNRVFVVYSSCMQGKGWRLVDR